MWEPQSRARSASAFTCCATTSAATGARRSPTGRTRSPTSARICSRCSTGSRSSGRRCAGSRSAGWPACGSAAHAPERVDRLVLCCTSAQLGPPEAGYARAATVRADGRRGDRRCRSRPVVHARLRATAKPRAVVERMRGDPDRHSARGLRRLLRGDRRDGPTGRPAVDHRADAGDRRARTIQPLPPEHGRRIAELIPGARLEVVLGAAHLANIERPELVTAMILSSSTSEEELK